MNLTEQHHPQRTVTSWTTKCFRQNLHVVYPGMWSIDRLILDMRERQDRALYYLAHVEEMKARYALFRAIIYAGIIATALWLIP